MPILQVRALRFNAMGTFQNMVADLKDVHQSTSRTIYCVTTALLRRLPQEIRLPTYQREAGRRDENENVQVWHYLFVGVYIFV